MLMKILKRLTQGGRYSNKLMADELGIDEGMVERMLVQLQQLGYIEKEDMSPCAGACDCGDSAKKGSCCSGGSIDINIWKVTSKGQETALKIKN